MELEFCPDFEVVRERWTDFWAGRNKRPLVSLINPKPGIDPAPRPQSYRLVYDSNVDAFVDDVLAWAATHEFLGDAIPSYQLSFAADHFAALLGAEIKHHPDSPNTNWIEPFVDDLDTADIRFRSEGKWWEWTVACTRALRKKCDGRLIIVATHLQGGLDALSAIRGNQKLLMDLIERPDAAERALNQINRAVTEARTALAEEVDAAAYGTMNRFNMYCDGLIDVPQCDFSCMISPAMFQRFQIPCLEHELAGLDHSIYHLDGPDAIQHLEALCSLERLDMIQWQPGAGNHGTDWSNLYQRIDDLGKGQFFWDGGDKGLQRLFERWQAFDSNQIYVSIANVENNALDDFLNRF